MHLIASYPIDEAAISQCCGQSVVAVTHAGDTMVGVLDRVQDGYAYFTAMSAPAVSTKALKKAIAKHPKVKSISRQRNKKGKKVSTKAFLGYPGYGYPGYGYPGFGYPGFAGGFAPGLGAGLGFALPLALIASLFAFPW